MSSSPLPGNWVDTTDTVGGVVNYRVKWTSGSAGAVAATLTLGGQIVSVTHGATGVYTVVLQSSYYTSVAFSGDIQQASYSKTGACTIRKTSDTASTGTIVVLVCDGDGDAVEPTTNDIIEMTFTVANYRT